MKGVRTYVRPDFPQTVQRLPTHLNAFEKVYITCSIIGTLFYFQSRFIFSENDIKVYATKNSFIRQTYYCLFNGFTNSSIIVCIFVEDISNNAFRTLECRKNKIGYVFNTKIIIRNINYSNDEESTGNLMQTRKPAILPQLLKTRRINKPGLIGSLCRAITWRNTPRIFLSF